MKFLFFAPQTVKPTGGIRVIYNYVARLCEMGVDAYVYHPTGNHEYQYADEKVPIFKGSVISSSDHLVIPDVFVSQIVDANIDSRQKYSLLIQNPYILRSVKRYSDLNKLLDAINRASRILCISDDAIEMITTISPHCESKVMRVTWSLKPDKFVNEQKKERLITYMPRKNVTHANLLLECLNANLPSNWKVQAIVGVSQKELCKILSQSSIFLQFGSFEGLPAPPVEAAISGNYVVGYHGNGGKEYWSTPNFINVNVGEISDFSRQVLCLVKQIESINFALDELHPGIKELVEKFSVDEERRCMVEFIDSISNDPIDKNIISVKTKLPFKTNNISYIYNRMVTKWIQLNSDY
jgi:glycosyltransferase involved in cell wall biosynthesis